MSRDASGFPEYSEEARTAGLQGSVILSIEVDSDGHTRDPRILYPLGMGLDEKAIAAVNQWQYASSANPNGPLRRQVVEVPFRLKPASPWVLDAAIFSSQPSGGTVGVTKPELRQYAVPDPAACSAQGYIEVNFQIGSDGAPSDIRVGADASGNLRDSVLRAVQLWRFRPASRNGSNTPGAARVLLECHPSETLATPSSIYSAAVLAPPELLFRLDPEYTDEARKAGLQGQVALSLVVQTDGKLSSVRIARPLGMGLDEQAIGAVMHWRFRPPMKDGKPVRAARQVTVTFSQP